MIGHRLRWESAIRGQCDTFKINNSAVSFMAKRFAKEHPHLADIFEFRSKRPCVLQAEV
jgi:hypothetical protein